MKRTFGLSQAAFLVACSSASPTDSSRGVSSTLRDDGLWEIIYVVEAKLPKGDEVTITNVRAPIEEEATRLCPMGVERIELIPISLEAGPGGLGLVTSTTGLATCKAPEWQESAK